MSDRTKTSDSFREVALPAILFIILAVATRVSVFGNPVVQIDEQFYLLVGDRIWQGWVPYVDVWDRKPIGLFLIYAAIRLLGGAGVYQYQICASLSAAATAFTLYRIASFIAPRPAAIASGAAYLLYLLVFNGVGGQSPVFYNLLMAFAVLLTIRALTAADSRNLFASGVAIMLLLGAAIQIKYTVVFEGIFIGISLLVKSWHEQRSPAALMASATAWVGSALLPTIAVLIYYAAHGQSDAFIQANFLSVFDRQEGAMGALKRLGETIALLSPLMAASLYGAYRLAPNSEVPPSARLFLCFWALAALSGYLIFGSYYDHYALPLLLPLSVLAAPAFASPTIPARILGVATFAIGLCAAALMVHGNIKKEGSRDQVERLTSIIKQNLHGKCMYVYEGPPILYLTTAACAPTKFLFPSHLGRSKEAKAIGVKPEDALRNLLSKKPQIVVMYEVPRKDANFSTRTVLQGVLRQQYHLVGREPLGRYRMLVYSRN